MHPLYPVLILFSVAAAFPGIVIEREDQLRVSYDYVVVGGGLSGLVVANRITEDPTKSVLVIEAGILPDANADDILIPGLFGTSGNKYTWGFETSRIAELGNKTFGINAGKVVGGGSAINGMFFQPASREDYDMWEKLGNPGWGWKGLRRYFKKSESFYPPEVEQVEEFEIGYRMEDHGRTGPVKVSYPSFIYPQFAAIVKALKSFGIAVPQDSASGTAMGALWAPSSQDPRDQTRSYAKVAYNDRSAGRQNYHLLTQRQVTRVLFQNKQATGVEFSSGPSSVSSQVFCKMEVILAAGALNTPKLLQLSGIGPLPVLEAHNIPVLVPLPGVGANYQDHPALFSVLNYSVTIPAPSIDANMLSTNSTYAVQMMAEYKANRTGPYTVSVGNLASFLPLPIIAPDDYQAIIKSARHASAAAFLPPTTDATIQAGFAAQKELLVRAFERGNVAVDEFIINSDLTPLWALQKPLSRGYVEISSADPFAPPNIHPRTASDPIDVAILLEATKHTRRFYASAGMAVFQPVETEVVLDETVVREKLVPTFDHPSCSCSMQPRRLGGVVDRWLRVYGVSGLRIVDASIMPIIPAAHLQSTMYAISEKAADIIRGLSNTK